MTAASVLGKAVKRMTKTAIPYLSEYQSKLTHSFSTDTFRTTLVSLCELQASAVFKKSESAIYVMRRRGQVHLSSIFGSKWQQVFMVYAHKSLSEHHQE